MSLAFFQFQFFPKYSAENDWLHVFPEGRNLQEIKRGGFRHRRFCASICETVLTWICVGAISVPLSCLSNLFEHLFINPERNRLAVS